MSQKHTFDSLRAFWGWISTHQGPLIVFLTAAITLGTCLGPLSSWRNPDPTEIAATEIDDTSTSSAESSEVKRQYQADLGRFPYASSFLFARYRKAEEDRIGRGWIDIYSATRDTFAKIDELACSYPDATVIHRNIEHKYLVVSCSYPSYFSNSESEIRKSDAVIAAWFFSNDIQPQLVLKCSDCREIIVTELSMEPAVKQIYVGLLTDAKTLTPNGRPDLSVDLSPYPTTPNESVLRRFIIQYKDDWTLSFITPRWKSYSPPESIHD